MYTASLDSCVETPFTRCYGGQNINDRLIPTAEVTSLIEHPINPSFLYIYNVNHISLVTVFSCFGTRGGPNGLLSVAGRQVYPSVG